MKNIAYASINHHQFSKLQIKLYQSLQKLRKKQKKQGLSRKELQQLLHYSLGTISNTLQSLRKACLIKYNRSTKTWSIIIRYESVIDNYDYLIKFRWDCPLLSFYKRKREKP